MSPEIPIGNITAVAIALHEMYTACIEVGFTAEQALQIILAMATTTQKGP